MNVMNDTLHQLIEKRRTAVIAKQEAEYAIRLAEEELVEELVSQREYSALQPRWGVVTRMLRYRK